MLIDKPWKSETPRRGAIPRERHIGIRAYHGHAGVAAPGVYTAFRDVRKR